MATRFASKALSIAALVAVSLLLAATTTASPAGYASPAQAVTSDLFSGSFAGAGLSRLDGTTGARVYANNMGSAIDLAFGPDGNLYVTTLFSSTVVRVNPATGAVLGTFASGGGLSTSVGVAFGPDGRLYVASRDTNQVLRYSGATGAFIDVFVSGSGGPGLSATEDIVFGPDGNLYVTEFYGNRVLRYNGITGAFIDVFATHAALNGARSMVFAPDGNLYVTGNFSDNIVRFNGATGAFLGVFATNIDGANGLALGMDGHFFVASEFGNAILRVNGTTGSIIGTFASVQGPVGITLAPSAGTYELFGMACSGSAGAPSLDKEAMPPEIGRTFVMAMTKLPAANVALVAFGRSDKTWRAMPLPLALDALGATGCKLLVSLDVLVARSTGTGTTTLSWPIPNDKRLIGAVFFNQLLVIDAPANPAGLTTSNGAKATVGGVY